MGIWRVVGGGQKNGIIVRAGKDLKSYSHTIRLQVGAHLKEIELCEDRLHYRKMCGEGPDSGWVSVLFKGKTIVEPLRMQDCYPRIKNAGSAVWRCVRKPFMAVRTDVSTLAPLQRVLFHGEEVEGEIIPRNGWLTLLDGSEGFALVWQKEFGQLLERVSTQGRPPQEKLLQPPPVQKETKLLDPCIG